MPRTKTTPPPTPTPPAPASPASSAKRSGRVVEGPAPMAQAETRGARRKRETRERLLNAAFRLMAERGMDAVAINEITEAADVGAGSFYNHFDSKEAIYAALIDSVFEGFGDALARLVEDIEDPAEVISVSVRHTLLRARREPLWGRFLVREGISPRTLSRGLGVRLMHDIQRGIDSGRFKVPDPGMTFIATAAGVLGAISTVLGLESQESATLKKLGLDADGLPERTAAVLLHGLGLPFQQAEAIARRKLPIPADSSPV